jgi:hydroxymethylpyrimidine pyrophosphatase-like HAD family hydrolase
MLQFAGTGVAMSNAAEEIKKAADKVAQSNNDDGIAIYLENEMKG